MRWARCHISINLQVMPWWYIDMKTAFATLLAIALPLSTVACTQTPAKQVQTVVAAADKPMFKPAQSNGYIVTANDEATVRRIYAKHGVTVLRAIGNGQFELHLQRDPGLAELNDLATHSGGAITAVQPNFTYQAN